MIRPATWIRYAASGAMLVALGGCFAEKKAKSSADDDNSKAFSELEKNDRDDTSAKAKDKDKSSSSDDKPKGPVFPRRSPRSRSATRRRTAGRIATRSRSRTNRRRSTRSRSATWTTTAPRFTRARRRSAWAGSLSSKAPSSRRTTTTHKEKLKTPAGKYECVVYEVAEDDGETWTYFFAKKLPGAPVFFFVERNGKRLRTTTLIDYLPGK